MNPALWGVFSAFAWGGADFAARFTSRALSQENALLGMLLVGTLVLTPWMMLSDAPFVWAWSGAWLLASTGVCTMGMTLLLYQGLARGPVTVVAPIVGCYPVLVVLLAFVLGSRPTPVQWTAMAVVTAGVVVVGRAAKEMKAFGAPEPGATRKTLLIALAAAAVAAIAVASGQAAVPVYGALETLWLSRLVSLATLMPLYLLPGYTLRLPGRWWPLLVLQGLLDAGAYFALFAGSHGPGSEIAAVTASGFGAVTVILARVFIGEAMTWSQWAGVVLIFGGVALLTAQG